MTKICMSAGLLITIAILSSFHMPGFEKILLHGSTPSNNAAHVLNDDMPVAFMGYFPGSSAIENPADLRSGVHSMPEDAKIVESPDFLPADSTGIKVFSRHCLSCHKESVESLAPGLGVLATMTPRAIYASLNMGKMRQQGAVLSDEERVKVSEWITRSKLKTTEMSKDAYTSFAAGNLTGKSDHSGWGNNPEGTGFRTKVQAGISPENVKTLKLKWAFAFPEGTITRSKPAVAGDWLIVGSQYGQVYAINRITGKIGWEYTAAAAIRGAISILKSKNDITAIFADYSSNVYAINVKTGKLKWNTRAGFEAYSQNTGSVVTYNGKVFVPIVSAEIGSAGLNNYECCTSSGGVVALNAETGKIIWTYRILPKAGETVKKKNGKSFYGPSGAPVWCSPTVDTKRGLLYIGTGQNYSDPATITSDALQAINMETGKLVWNFQATGNDAYNIACPVFLNCPTSDGPDLDFGMAPMIIKGADGKDMLIAGQKSGVVYALTPAGKLIWKSRIGKGGKLGGIHWGMATDGTNVYACNADNPIALDKTNKDVQPSPGVYALNIKTGDTVWSARSTACAPDKVCINGNSAAPVVVPGIVFAGSLSGKLRAYSTFDGSILWEFDTAIPFETVNGIKGKGGSIDGPPPVVADGMLFVSSGYGMFGQASGNVLLAFETEALSVK
ncbi:MAG: dehydrogenase [Chitinophagaceae bacterium]|nr:MAG: dehydrogenase [Chitinophagaceae bacterium]